MLKFIKSYFNLNNPINRKLLIQLWIFAVSYSLVGFIFVNNIIGLDLSWEYVTYIIISIFTFYCGFKLSKYVKISEYKIANTSILFYLCLILCLMTIAEYAYFVIRFGAPPLFLEDPDSVRNEISFNSLFHLIARLNVFVLPIVIFRSKKLKKQILIFILIFISICCFFFLERAIMVFYIGPFILHYFLRNSLLKIIPIFLLGLLLLSSLKYLREVKSEGALESLENIGLDNSLKVAGYFFFGTLGFENTVGQFYWNNRDQMNQFKEVNLSLVHPFLSLFSDPVSMQDVQKSYFQNSDQYLTSGPFGILVVDYGKLVFIFTLFYGFLWGLVINNLTGVKLYTAYLWFLLSVYDFIFTSFYPWLYIFIIFLI